MKIFLLLFFDIPYHHDLVFGQLGAFQLPQKFFKTQSIWCATETGFLFSRQHLVSESIALICSSDNSSPYWRANT